jgi:hypothetical protein
LTESGRQGRSSPRREPDLEAWSAADSPDEVLARIRPHASHPDCLRTRHRGYTGRHVYKKSGELHARPASSSECAQLRFRHSQEIIGANLEAEIPPL